MPRRGNYLPPPSLSKLRNSRRHPDSEINSAERVISSRFTLVSQAFRAALPPAQQGDMCQEEWTAGGEKESDPEILWAVPSSLSSVIP